MNSSLVDAVVFDLDGTLVATDTYWLPAARAGCARAFEELGLEREPPAPRDWLGLLGLPFEVGLARILPDLTEAERRVVGDCAQREQARLLEAGPAYLLPGVEALLEELHGRGVSIGVASNCSSAYLDAVVGGSDVLSRFVDEPRCLGSPGVREKADMVRDLLAVFDTRRALVVGDREVDAAAARANGLPFAHCTFGFCPDDEVVESQAVLGDAADLLGVLERRPQALRALADELSAAAAAPTIAVSGAPGAGSTLLAEDLARVLEGSGIPVRTVRTDGLLGREPGPASAAALGALDEALGAGAPGVRILEGWGLLGRGLEDRFESSVYLDVGEGTGLDRLAALWDAGLREQEPRGRWDLERDLRARRDPRQEADRVLSGENPLDPLPAGA